MKKIKTIIKPIDDYSTFDNIINNLLLNGWNIVDRKIINIKGEPNEVGSASTVQSLYAELEKEVCYFEEVTN